MTGKERTDWLILADILAEIIGSNRSAILRDLVNIFSPDSMGQGFIDDDNQLAKALGIGNNELEQWRSDNTMLSEMWNRLDGLIASTVYND
jgi:hypothetical protein